MVHGEPGLIGVFDSGVGGLSVLAEVRRRLPDADLVYLADRAHATYGPRSLSDVRRLAVACTGLLLGLGAKMIVVACNTASAAALHHLRALHPQTAFVGMEPALRPAVAITRSGVVGVLATDATFQGELFSSLMGRFRGGAEVIQRACPGWAELVESGEVSGPNAEQAVAFHLDPVLSQGADTLVLGCTHYPFLQPLIAARAGAQVSVVDPAPAVGRRVAQLWLGAGHRGFGALHLLTTGDPVATSRLTAALTGVDAAVTAVTLP